jgi:hypothetical protein
MTGCFLVDGVRSVNAEATGTWNRPSAPSGTPRKDRSRCFVHPACEFRPSLPHAREGKTFPPALSHRPCELGRAPQTWVLANRLKGGLPCRGD